MITGLGRIGQYLGIAPKNNAPKDETIWDKVIDALHTSPVSACKADTSLIDDLSDEDGIPLDDDDSSLGGEGGDPEMSDGFWQSTSDYGMQGSDFFEQGTLTIGTSEPLTGSGLQDIETLVLEVGTNSSLISHTFSSDGSSVAMPEGGYFGGLINITPASWGWPGTECSEDGYSDFLHCPSDESWQAPLYLADYLLLCHTLDGTHSVDKVISTVDELMNDPESGAFFGPIYGSNAEPYVVTIPHECYHADYGQDGSLSLDLTMTLYVDNRNIVTDQQYETYTGGVFRIPTSE